MARYKIKDGRELRIAVSGKSGCGNTTVSSLLADALGIKLINYTFRQLARERGLTLEQVIENAKSDDSYDRYIDTHQTELAEKESCVLGSRLAIWIFEKADIKVYLKASDAVRARRIFGREGGDLQRIIDFTAMRDKEDTRRYKKIYGIDNDAYEAIADIVVDTENKTPDIIADDILSELASRGFVEKID